MDKKVSVIIPVYNNEKYVDQCVWSVINQSYHNLDIILIDDGSTDSSGIQLDHFAAIDSRIHLIHQENAGVSAARNAGLRVAEGDYLTFIDGDDYVSENYISGLVLCAETNQAEMVICGLKKVDTNGNILEEIIPGEYKRFEKEEWTFRLSLVAAHLYSRELWERYQITFYEGERGEDIPISLFFSAICTNIKTLKENGYYYVQHKNSASNSFQGLKKHALPYKALEETIKKIQSIHVKNSEEFHELFVLRILVTFIQLARGAKKEEINQLMEYIDKILDIYYPKFYKNKKINIMSGLDIPILQKIVVNVFVRLKRMGLLSYVIKIIC
ncbi:MAG: glycosyltransferase [Lachnospiraceae bacterium]|nr:glycosyltransferase [Lachnospiraceae bacterium]